MTFTIEIKSAEQQDRCEVEIYLDRDGRHDLLKRLSFLKDAGGGRTALQLLSFRG
jgi:hypothetical protein